MLIGNLVGLLIILICVAYQYQKSTLMKSFAILIVTLSAGTAALAFFEPLANIFLSRSDNSRFEMIVPWAQPLSFVLLFIVVFSVLQTIFGKLYRQKVELGNIAEQIGRVICGLFVGLILSGTLLTLLLISPLPVQYPYPRFESTRPNPNNPNKVFFKPDGFVTGWFSLLSRGSLSGKRSFAALHPSFLDEAFLNRIGYSSEIPIVSGSESILVPRRQRAEQKALAVWPAPDELKNSQGNSLPPKSRHHLMIVRIGIKRTALEKAGKFTPSQLRLICKREHAAQEPLRGENLNAYPLGYMLEENRLKTVDLSEQINISFKDFEEGSRVKWLDFAFYVPEGYVPVLLAFKQDTVVELPAPAAPDEAPQPATFNPQRESTDSK